MARDGFAVFDSDMHVLEPVDLWERYLDAPWKHRAPRGTRRTPMDVGVRVEQMLALETMTLGGVLARFPRLRVAFLEGNGSWPPFWLWRLDEHWAKPGHHENPERALKPSEYFHRQCWVSVECEETTSPAAIERCGADRFVFSTDYPHYDTEYPEATAHFLKPPLPEEAKRKILWDNCARLYGVPRS
jgi:predicted TIM-barrel fold metal-dependent hydrolase